MSDIQTRMNISLKNIVLVLSLLGVIFSLYLVILDIQTNGYCPKITFIPACYIALFAYLLIVFSEMELIKKYTTLFFNGGLFIGFILAIWFSFNQFFHYEECPQLFRIPFCYLSLILFILILIAKKR